MVVKGEILMISSRSVQESLEIRVGAAEAIAFEPVAARAYRMLERMIVTLELPPASVTTEGALIQRLGLGR